MEMRTSSCSPKRTSIGVATQAELAVSLPCSQLMLKSQAFRSEKGVMRVFLHSRQLH
jgi:hypothetical protein